MNPLMLLRNHQADAELDAAAWVDDQPLLRPIVRLLAHHRTLHAATSVAIGMALAPVVAVATVATCAGSLIDQAHEVAGEGTDPCGTCLTAEADEFAADATPLTYEDICHAWDLSDGGLT